METLTVGEALINLLEQAGVENVFGIPGVHTVELYRGLDQSTIRHITPRHEQGAAFMADGYARVSGKPAVCLLITGPGLTNAATGVAQARAESIPMLVISSVNRSDSLGKHLGHLHELPDQAAFANTLFLESFRVTDPEMLGTVFHAAMARMSQERPGPVHIDIPTDVLKLKVKQPIYRQARRDAGQVSDEQLRQAAALCDAATAPVLVLGGGAARATEPRIYAELAERLDAPTITTTNARGLIGNHPLSVPASPSLAPVRDLIASADLILILGSEIGPTDFDMYQTGEMPPHPNMIRIDVDPEQFSKRSDAGLKIKGDAASFAQDLTQRITPKQSNGTKRAAAAINAVSDILTPDYKAHVSLIDQIWASLPDAVLIGDSTQITYAGNLFVHAPSANTWFNASTGFGTLGFAAPAAIGASLAKPDTPFVCITGDGGLQFTMPELGTACDTNANVVFLVWNNEGYREIETSMTAADVSPVGVTPTPPDFVKIADAYGLPAIRISDPNDLGEHLKSMPRPCLIEIHCP